MKTLLFFFLYLLIARAALAQTYVALAPALTNEAGTLAGKSNLSLELGRQWDVFSIGLDLGKSSLGRMKDRDTSVYLELRPNLNVFQQGKFTNTFTAGIGYIFNAKESLMTELTSGIEYALNKTWHFNMYFGQYYYSGRTDASTTTFFGVSAMFYFSEFNGGKGLIKQADK
ncbi:MAG: MipA/OmpV family protein [Williamsia sp.]|nr:MipA/OmpV family protein [Williamsia sp.]